MFTPANVQPKTPKIVEEDSILEDSLNSFSKSLSIVIPEPNFEIPIEVYGEFGPLS